MTNETQKEVRLTVVVSKELRRKAKIKSAQTGKSIAQVMREAIEAWVADGDLPKEGKK